MKLKKKSTKNCLKKINRDMKNKKKNLKKQVNLLQGLILRKVKKNKK
jgi:hypothetical protein